jgi:hypothetical protein
MSKRQARMGVGGAIVGGMVWDVVVMVFGGCCGNVLLRLMYFELESEHFGRRQVGCIV